VDAFVWIDQDMVMVAPPKLLTSKHFADRFTDAELTAVMDAASHNPAVAAWLERFRATQQINLDSPTAQLSVHALELAGLLAPGRAAQILS
jgi:hypothetical protein